MNFISILHHLLIKNKDFLLYAAGDAIEALTFVSRDEVFGDQKKSEIELHMAGRVVSYLVFNHRDIPQDISNLRDSQNFATSSDLLHILEIVQDGPVTHLDSFGSDENAPLAPLPSLPVSCASYTAIILTNWLI